MRKGFIIAIDGPAAAGKGTIALQLEKRLNGFYLYSGATYRSVALIGIQNGIDLQDTKKIIELVPHMQIQFAHGKILLNNEDVTERIKEHDTAAGSSVIGVIPEVREALVAIQRRIGQEAMDKGEIVVIEGRDTATKVFPDAAVKIFLTASAEVRAKRRLAQYLAQGEQTDFATVLEEIRQRDDRDTQRKTDPLVKEPEKFGYVVIDDSEMTEEETIQNIMNEVKRRNLLND